MSMRIIKLTLIDGDGDEVYFIETDRSYDEIISLIKGFRKKFRDAKIVIGEPNDDFYNWDCYDEDMRTKIGRLLDFEDIDMELY